MVRLRKGNRVTFFPFSDEEVRALGLEVDAEYELLKAKEGVYVLARVENAQENRSENAGSKKTAQKEPLEGRVLALLAKARGTEAMEGRFENLLSKEEHKVFSRLLEEGKVERFKTSEKYDKHLYRAARAGAKSAKNGRDGAYFPGGYYFTSSEQEAREINDAYAGEIRAGKIVGLRDFDGTYYILENGFLESAAKRILGQLEKSRRMRIEELAQKTGLDAVPVRGVCAVLKERGDVTEKRKGEYLFIP